MAGNYQPSTGSNIGALLRAIQEEKQQSPIQGTANEPGSPIRNLTQQPVFQAESPDSARVSNVRPELQTQAEAPLQVVRSFTPPPPEAVDSPIAATPSVGSRGSASAPARPSAPSIATKIVSAPAPKAAGSVLSASVKKAAAPAPVSKPAPPKPSPTPAPKNNAAAGAAGAGIGLRLIPQILSRAAAPFLGLIAASNKSLQQGLGGFGNTKKKT